MLMLAVVFHLVLLSLNLFAKKNGHKMCLLLCKAGIDIPQETVAIIAEQSDSTRHSLRELNSKAYHTVCICGKIIFVCLCASLCQSIT